MDEKKPTIVLHIGLHKTGTTSIQRFLHENYEALLRQGVLYPLAGRFRKDGERHESHLMLAWSVVERYARKYDVKLSDQPWVSLRKEIEEKKPGRVVLSSEFFWSATKQEVEQIRSYLDRYPVKVLLYMRNPVNLALSTYKQGVKSGGISSGLMTHFMARLRQYDFEDTFTRWASVFGSDQVKVHIFEKAKQDLVGHFTRVAGIEWSDRFEIPPPANVSPSDSVIQLVRWINTIEQWLGPFGLDRLAHRARRNILCGRTPGRWLAHLVNRLPLRPIASEEDVRQIRNETLELVERFVERRVCEKDRKYFSHTTNGN